MNYGKKIEKVIITDGYGIENVLDIVLSGQVFRVDYLKSDGSFTTMTCRTGVSKYVKGTGESKTDLVDKRQVSVWSFDRQGYRTLKLDKIIILKHGGVLYDFRNAFATKLFKRGEFERAIRLSMKPGLYDRNSRNNRTVEAQNGFVLK